MADRKNNTLVYSPKIDAIVATTNGPVDISADIINFQLRRVVNAASQFSCVLNNRNQKYTGRLGRMDRITVFLTRVAKHQVFSGYLDSVPGIDLYPTTCEIQATCTLKRLMNTWWDPGLPESVALLNQHTFDGSQTPNPNAPQPTDATADPADKASDSGMGAMLGAVLTEVAGWNKDQIFIQNIPAKFMELGLAVADKREQKEQIEILKKILGISTSGTSTTGTTTPGTPAVAINMGDYKENFESDDFYAKFTGPYPTGADNVERWRPLAMLALQQMSVDASVIDVMMHRIGQESSGDPNIENTTDSNAQAGHPSIGILQCIKSTFDSNAIAPFNTHIRSPFGSMLASLNYVKNSHWKGDYQAAYQGTAGY